MVVSQLGDGMERITNLTILFLFYFTWAMFKTPIIKKITVFCACLGYELNTMDSDLSQESYGRIHNIKEVVL